MPSIMLYCLLTQACVDVIGMRGYGSGIGN
jgi:hypothetical protein